MLCLDEIVHIYKYVSYKDTKWNIMTCITLSNWCRERLLDLYYEDVIEIIQDIGFGIIIKYVDEQTYELCLFAVRSQGSALQYVCQEFMTNKMCYLAILNDGLVMQYIKKAWNVGGRYPENIY